jgi:hypothetical protein
MTPARKPGRPPGARDTKPRLKVRRGPKSDAGQPRNGTRARIAAVLAQHPEWGPAQIAEELGDVTRQAVWAAMRRMG